MNRLVASTCGTSIFTQPFAGPDPAVAQMLRTETNLSEREFQGRPDLAAVDAHMDRVTERLLAAPRHVAEGASAEIHTLIRLYGEGWPQEARGETLVLLHTDTHIGRRAAEAVQGWLEAQDVHATLHRMLRLTTASTAAFEAGMHEVVNWCAETDQDWRQKGVRVVYNLSGGFKSWQGYMSALGMLFADELVYIFETGHELIRIPLLPLQFDLEDLGTQIDLLRRMHHEPVPAEEAAVLKEALLQAHEGQAGLSVLGEMLFVQCAKRVYPQRILPSPHPRVRLGPRVAAGARGWAGRREMADLNHRIDDLVQCVCHRHNPDCNPARLNFKKLVGNPHPPSDHEFYLWSDGAAGRGFGHFEGDTFVVDTVDGHLP